MTVIDSPTQIVIAGAGYAGLHIALRLSLPATLVDQHPYHQVITELPRVATGTRAADAVRLPVKRLLGEHVSFVQARLHTISDAGDCL